MEKIDKNDPFYRECRQCKRPFIAMHGNRYFCDPSEDDELKRNCKTTFNNLIAKKKRDLLKDFSPKILKNQSIIHDFHSKGKEMIDGEDLTDLGFDESITTGSVYLLEFQRPCPLYLNYILISLGNNKFKIRYHGNNANEI